MSWITQGSSIEIKISLWGELPESPGHPSHPVWPSPQWAPFSSSWDPAPESQGLGWVNQNTPCRPKLDNPGPWEGPSGRL